MNRHMHNHDEKTVYTCPMHPEVIKNAPGKCPGCGMDLIPKKADSHLSHNPEAHTSHDG
mgnify:CR=1 FL=1